MKSIVTRVTLISFLLILVISNTVFAETKAVKEPDAVAAYSEAIKLNPKDANEYVNRGIAYGKLGNHHQVIKDYDKAIELNPQLARAYYKRGSAYADLGNYSQAIKDYNTTIQINPLYAEVYYSRGLSYQMIGNYNQAISDIKIDAGRGLKEAQNFLSKRGIDWTEEIPKTASSDKSSQKTGEKPIAPQETVVDVSAITDKNNSKPSETISSQEEVKNFVSKWLNSWKSGNMKTYSKCYASVFESKGKNLNAWISYKTTVHEKSKNINITIENLQISADENEATAVFTQYYSSSIMKDSGKKTLELRKINNEWKIFREIMQP